MACLLFISYISKLFLAFPTTLIEAGGMAGWLIALIISLLSLFYFWLITLLMKKFPGKTIVEITEEVLGPYLGTAANLLYAAFFFNLVIILFRQYGETMIASTLPRAPISIIVGVFALAAGGTLLFTIQTLARTARIVTPFIAAALALSLLTVLTYFNWNNFFPILGTGPVQLVTQGIKYSGIAEALLAALLLPVFQGWEHFRKAGLYGIAAGGAALVAFTFVYQGVFITNEAVEEALPYYRLTGIIQLGRFFQRIEAIFLLSWSMVGMIKLAVSLYAGALVLTKTLKLPDHRPVLLLSLILTFALSFAPPDLPSTIELDTFTRIWAFLPTVILPAFILFLTFFKKKKGGTK